MLVSRKLLNRYVDLEGISTQELADSLTNAGLEVEGIDSLIQGTNLVVGYVESCEPHPDSDHLNITQVNLGDIHEQIVCGAENIAAGQYVVVAKVGAELKDMSIKETKVRGVQSNGMICSLNELGVAEKFQTESQKTGIVTLPKSEPGSDPAVALGLDDEILDVSQTPNRSDFMSIFAIAHEVAAIYEREVKIPEIKNHMQTGTKSDFQVSSETEKCFLFLAKVVNSVTVKESPSWMREVLIGSGIKPINNLVDISNFVMLETGQPMHFYDKKALGTMTLSVADNLNQTVVALDDHEYELKENDLVILNGDKPVGIAGIMGLGNTMIQEDTTDIVIEAARFNHVSVRKTATRLGLSTDSSQRFTKPMDNMATFNAVNRAVDLLIEYADASGIEDTVQYGDVDLELKKIKITSDKINSYLGTKLENKTIVSVFERLNFNPTVSGDIIECTVPSYRKDLDIEVDLIEEVIRIVGYDILEETLPLLDLTMGSLNPFQRTIRQIESVLLGNGANQTNTYTLVDLPKTQGLFSFGTPVKLMSPISDKRAYLRTQLFNSMLEVLSYNNSHKISEGLYFEHTAIQVEGEKTHRLGLIGSGSLIKENWNNVSIDLDFFTLKGILMNLFDQLGYAEKRFEFKSDCDFGETLHPYKSAQILINRKPIGYIGHVHPRLLKENDLKDAVYAEIDLDILLGLKGSSIKAQPVAKYPIMTRDLAVLCDKDIAVKDLIQSIEKGSKRYLVDLNVFDVFTSEKLGDKKSIAFQLSFGQNRTLEIEEINAIMEEIKTLLVEKHNVEIR